MTARLIVLVVALLSLPGAATAQVTTLGFDVDVPDLDDLFRVRPPMGDCPVGDVDQAGAPAPSRHLLHIGVADFFLDHPLRLRATPEQAATLRQMRNLARETWLDQQTGLAQLENKLWMLTGATDPALADIEATVVQIERARAAQRLAFIVAVQDAAAVLTGDQRRALIGVR